MPHHEHHRIAASQWVHSLSWVVVSSGYHPLSEASPAETQHDAYEWIHAVTP